MFENEMLNYSSLHAIEGKSKEERFYQFMELLSESGTFGLWGSLGNGQESA